MVMKANKVQFDYHVVDFDATDVQAALTAAAAGMLARNPGGAPAAEIDDSFRSTVIMDSFGCKVYFKAKSPALKGD